MDKTAVPPPPPIVYVVDQDSPVRDGLCLLLTTIGIDSEEYDSAERFLESFDPDRLGCLVTEVDLPGLSGLDLLDRLRDRQVELSAVVLARHGEVGPAVRAVRAGAIDFLEKPVVDRILLRRVLEVLGRDQNRVTRLSEGPSLRPWRARQHPRPPAFPPPAAFGGGYQNL